MHVRIKSWIGRSFEKLAQKACDDHLLEGLRQTKGNRHDCNTKTSNDKDRATTTYDIYRTSKTQKVMRRKLHLPENQDHW
jgi:hypothetical protein